MEARDYTESRNGDIPDFLAKGDAPGWVSGCALRLIPEDDLGDVACGKAVTPAMGFAPAARPSCRKRKICNQGVAGSIPAAGTKSCPTKQAFSVHPAISPSAATR